MNRKIDQILNKSIISFYFENFNMDRKFILFSKDSCLKLFGLLSSECMTSELIEGSTKTEHKPYRYYQYVLHEYPTCVVIFFNDLVTRK